MNRFNYRAVSRVIQKSFFILNLESFSGIRLLFNARLLRGFRILRLSI